MKKEVLLFTSGVDSYIAREYLISQGHDIDCLYFNHGGRYCLNEIRKINMLPFEVLISDNLVLGDIEADDAFIPNRNLLMTIMAQSMGYEKVWLGGSLSDRIGDNKSEVFQRLSELLSTTNESYIRIDSPFYGCYKDDMVKWWVSKHPASRMDLAKNTFSCFEPLEEPTEASIFIQGFKGKFYTDECLCCPACFRKCSVLWNGDIFIHHKNKSIVDHYEEQFIKPIVKTPRSTGTMNYIERWYEELDHGEEENSSI